MATSVLSSAIPVINNARECANYTLTLAPYVQQLQHLSTALPQHLSSVSALKQLYLTTNPVITGFAASLLLSPPFLAAAEFNRNYSQVDRFWSLLPTLYNLHWSLWTRLSHHDSTLLDLRLLISLIWSIRLTYNYHRRGGYNRGSEDYRWLVVKTYLGQPAFFLLDVLFISLAQNILLFLVTVPSYLLVLLAATADNQHTTTTITALDYLFAATILLEIALTALADQQQYTFQTAKHVYNSQKPSKNDDQNISTTTTTNFSPAELERGFRTTGLYALARHPNFTFEQSVWWTFYFWAALRVGSLGNWTAVGPGCYSLVFAASTPLTEYISKRKYPAYGEYQAQVGCFLPWVGRGSVVFSGTDKEKKEKEGVEGSSRVDEKGRNGGGL